MKWVTRQRPKVDRIACPWLIRRFIDTDAEFLFAAADQVLEVAAAQSAHSFDAKGAAYSHRKFDDGREWCTFETLIDSFGLGQDAALMRLAKIVHAADVASDVDSHPFGAALRAIGDAGSIVEADDHRLLERASFVYDALYAYCQQES